MLLKACFYVLFLELDVRQPQKIILQYAYPDNRSSLLKKRLKQVGYAKLENLIAQAAPPPTKIDRRVTVDTMTSAQGSRQETRSRLQTRNPKLLIR